MYVVPFENLACPIDGLNLALQDRQLKCANNHCFDVARQRYVNLLPIQDKRSKHPGDSKDMIEARSRLLNAGIYQVISDKTNELVLRQAQNKTSKPFTVVDAGCGEGYYLDKLKQAALDSPSDAQIALLGVDIAKPAIVSATQRDRQNITWVVGTNRKLPVLEKSVDMLLCMFGFPVFDAFKHYLKHSGAILLVESGPSHLIELRQRIYNEVKTTPTPAHEKAIELGFSLAQEDSVNVETAPLNAEQIQDLLMMTPHFFKASRAKRDSIMQMTEMTLTLDVRFRLLTLNKAA